MVFFWLHKKSEWTGLNYVQPFDFSGDYYLEVNYAIYSSFLQSHRLPPIL